MILNNIDESLENIKSIYNIQEKRIKYLEKENKELKEEHYKDDEIQKMKKKFTDMEESYYRGFPISKEEKEKIDEWIENHLKEEHWDKEQNKPLSSGAIGGRFTYQFIPTSIGVVGTVICSCKKGFTFQNI